MTAVAGGFATRSRSPVPSRLCGQLESNAQKWLSPDSGAGGSVDGWRHPAFAVKSVSNRSSSSSARPCHRAIRGRRNTDEYSASRTLDIQV